MATIQTDQESEIKVPEIQEDMDNEVKFNLICESVFSQRQTAQKGAQIAYNIQAICEKAKNEVRSERHKEMEIMKRKQFHKILQDSTRRQVICEDKVKHD